MSWQAKLACCTGLWLLVLVPPSWANPESTAPPPGKPVPMLRVKRITLARRTLAAPSSTTSPGSPPHVPNILNVPNVPSSPIVPNAAAALAMKAAAGEPAGPPRPAPAETSLPWLKGIRAKDFQLTNHPLLERLVRSTYDSYTDLITRSGQKIHFALSNFATLDAGRFATTSWESVVTLPGGRAIQTQRNFFERGGTRHVQYVPRWEVAPDEESAAASAQAAKLPLTEILKLGAGDTPEFAQVKAVTTFRVTVTLAGARRTYRAAFLWLQGSGEVRFLPFDYVSGMVEAGLSETAVPGVPDQTVASARPLDQAVPKDLPAGQCTPGSQPGFPRSISNVGSGDSTGHVSGQHSITANFSFDCSCDADCTTHCNGGGMTASCAEFGTLTGRLNGSLHCHKLSAGAGTSLVNGLSLPSDPTNPQCSEAAACAWKDCTACLCGSVTVGVTPFGVGFSYATAPADAIPIAVQQSMSCPKCTPPQPPPPPPPPPKKKVKVRKRCTCGRPGPCAVAEDCVDAATGEVGYDTCDEAAAAVPDPSCSACGDGVCDPDEDCSSCPDDCGECPPAGYCGDGTCNGDETQQSCCTDCGCPTNYTCGTNGCACTAMITQECGSFTDECGDFHDLGDCPVGEVCVENACVSDPSSGDPGGSGGGGGGGGGDLCDPNGNGMVTVDQCEECGGTADLDKSECDFFSD